MVIQTSRFGSVNLKPEDILTFAEGLLGFTDLREFVLLDDPNDEIFAWLQSCESPAIAFPVLEPELFTENFKINLTKTDLVSLKLQSQDKARFSKNIQQIPDDPTLMTANMKAPVVVNIDARIARQCVLQQWLGNSGTNFCKASATGGSKSDRRDKESSPGFRCCYQIAPAA